MPEPATSTAARDRLFRRNATGIVLFDMFWGLGSPCVLTAAILPAYLLGAGASKLGVQGAMLALAGVGTLQVLSGRLHHGSRRKWLNLSFWIAFASCWIVVGALGWAGWIRPGGWGSAAMVLAASAAVSACGALGTPAYWELTLDMVPPHRRGAVAWARTFSGAACGIVGSILAEWIISGHPAPLGFHVAFSVGGPILLVSCMSMLVMKDPKGTGSFSASSAEEVPVPAVGSHQERREKGQGPAAPSIRSCLRSMLGDCAFLRFAACYAMVLAALSLAPLAIAYGRDVGGMSESQAGSFIFANFVTTALLGAVIPLLGDRFGFRFVAIVHAAAMVVAAFLVLASGGGGMLLLAGYGCFAACGAVAGYLMVHLGTELLPGVQPATVIGVGTIISAPLAAVVGPLGGLTADTFGRAGYTAIFSTAAILAAVAAAGYILLVHEPRHARH